MSRYDSLKELDRKRPHSRKRNNSGKTGTVKVGKGLGKTKPSNR